MKNPTMNPLGFWILIVGTLSFPLLATFNPLALADTSEEILQNHHAMQPTLTKDYLERRLHKEETNVGFALGAGFGVEVFGGTRYFLREKLAFVFQYRWFHLSNAGLDYPNYGTNTQMFYLGLDWFL